MIEHLYSSPGVIRRIRSGPLGAFVDSYAEGLHCQGYTRSTLRWKLRLAGALSRWMHEEKILITGLGEDIIARFLAQVATKHCIANGGRFTLKQLLQHLRQLEAIPSPSVQGQSDAVHTIEGEYSRYLAQERGLSPLTIRMQVSLIRRFLLASLGRCVIDLARLGPQHIEEFTISLAQRLKRRSTETALSALKGFLRFLYVRGETPTNLAGSVLKIACWRLASLPKSISLEEVEHLLDCVDRSTPTGLRDYAILLLLARLGLRAGEVANLELRDINWVAGELTARGKSVRQDRLPIPHDVGQAIVRYLHDGRPRRTCRRVFLRVQAPIEGFKSCAAITSIVRKYVLRAGLNPSKKGAHLLRHSLATRMLREGSSLAEIGNVLRHQNTSTTEIYAKVDVLALRSLAQPWPGDKT